MSDFGRPRGTNCRRGASSPAKATPNGTRRVRHQLGLTRSMWRRIEDLVRIRGDHCVCGRQFVDQEHVLTGFDAGHRLIMAGAECRGRVKVPVICSIYLPPRTVLRKILSIDRAGPIDIIQKLLADDESYEPYSGGGPRPA
jgi:hypothetical protein